jgi:D-alanine-D-alanine ligase-like ATP-grasp enzyme
MVASLESESSVNSQAIWDTVNEPVRMTVEFAVPEGLVLTDWSMWTEVFVAQNAWQDDAEVPAALAHLKAPEQQFIAVFLRLSRWFLELARLPVFAQPTFLSWSPHASEGGGSQMIFELPAVDLMPSQAYETAVRVARDICQWMARHAPTAEHVSKVFEAVDQHVVKALASVVPAGKSTIPVLKVAHEMGIPFLHLGLGVYQLGWGSKSRRLDRSTTEMDSAIGSKLAQNKVATANLLRTAGLPAPTHGVVLNEADALKVAVQLNFPLVVKPLDRDRGEGVTVSVMDEDALKLAFAHAQQLSHSKQVIIEQQVPGVCHRLFIVGEKLLYAVKRMPMSVQGDGQSSVHQLVAHEVAVQSGRPPWLRSGIAPLDDLALHALRCVGMTPESVPARGVHAPLRPIESTSWGGVDEEVTHTIDPDNIAAAVQAAQLFGLHVAGVDIISADISRPWHANGAIINEVNYAPLLGGGDISKSHIPRFLAEFMPGQGRIRIRALATLEAAIEAQAASVKTGLRCFVSSAEKTLAPSGKDIIMPLQTLHQRLKALVCRSDVDEIVLVRHQIA